LTFGISMISRDLMLERRNVVGNNPMFYVVDELEEIDIDTPLDFEFAKFVYEKHNG